MIIERLFGKGREAKAKDSVEDQPEPGRPPGKSVKLEASESPARPNLAATSPRPAPESSVAVTNSTSPEPSGEEIAARAYDLWQAQGRPGGREQENWSEAERQLRAERAQV